MQDRTGRCNCGRITIRTSGEPSRVGLCHCHTCRRETGSAFNAFAVWPADRVVVSGTPSSWTAGTDRRHFCPDCGASLFATVDGEDEVEVRLGALDEAPSGLTPTYELWLPRRERWLVAVAGADQHQGNRPSGTPAPDHSPPA